jgi:hypothetical protein
MTLCPADKGHCSCQPDEGVFCPRDDLIARLQRGMLEAWRADLPDASPVSEEREEPSEAMLLAAKDCTPVTAKAPDFRKTARSIYLCMRAADRLLRAPQPAVSEDGITYCDHLNHSLLLKSKEK